MTMGRRTPRPVSSALQAAIEPLAPLTPLAAVQSAWPAAVGDTIAAQAAPVSEHEGVITVACRSATWANELDLLADQTLDRLRSELPEGVSVSALRFSAREGLD